MAEAAGSPEFYSSVIPIDERVLTEVDHILEYRNADGSIDQSYLDGVLTNLTSAVQEAAMPFAVSTVRHEFEYHPETNKKTFTWLGKTAVQAAISGYRYHQHEAARARVGVEVEEARDSTESLDTEVVKVFISPRMTRADASLSEARREHLGDDDSVRVSWLETDERGEITNRVMQALLVRDIPYDAWVSMLRSEDNIFGNPIDVEDDGSALSVMKVHRELEMPVGALKDGPVDIVEAVIPYIEDPAIQHSVIEQVKLFRGNQEDMQAVAEAKAEQWLEFDMALAESLHQERATFEVERFIVGLQEHWGDKELEAITQHELSGGGYRMSRQLAVVLEKAKQNTLWAGAASMVVNPEVMQQLDPEAYRQIQQNEALIQIARQNGMDYYSLEADNNRLIAGKNIKVGGGCTGVSENAFGPKFGVDGSSSEETSESISWDDKNNRKYKAGKCRVKACDKKGEITKVGPCSVCESCQAKFDRGEDPTSVVSPVRKVQESDSHVSLDSKEMWASFERNEIDDELHVVIEDEKTKSTPNIKDQNSLVSV